MLLVLKRDTSAVQGGCSCVLCIVSAAAYWKFESGRRITRITRITTGK